MEPTSEEDIRAILDGAFKGRRDVGLINYRLLSNSPNGFNGLYYTILIKYSEKSGEAELSCFAKALPLDERHLADLRGSRLVHKEHEFFLRLVPTFEKFINFELPLPRCYYFRFDESAFGRTLSVQEDLQEQGFVMRDKLVPMNAQELSVTMPAMARLHAASMVTEQKSDIHLRTFCRNPEEALWTLDKSRPFYPWLQSAIDTVVEVAKRRDRFAQRIGAPGAERKVTAAFEQTRLKLQISDTYCNVVCHGDIWNNNLMYRYSEDGEPIAVRIFDFQNYRVVPPITDLLMFIFVNSSRQVRAQVMDRLVSEYWRTLDESLRDANCRLPPEMVDLPAMRRLVDEFWLAGIVTAAGYVPMCQMPPGSREKNVPQAGENQLDFDVMDDFLRGRGKAVLRGMGISQMFAKNVEDIIEELFEYIGI
ncbi:uncharacterized protein LOC135948615 [Cloeon dipterum]|uniref:uncharacterized protein LOC135948615 n=1 Tax=Cloeon dipterum TaxID=197152 RepID=UPI00321FFBD1